MRARRSFGIGDALDQTLVSELVEDSDQPRLVVSHLLGKGHLRRRRRPGQMRERDVGPHRETASLQQWPLGVDEPAGDACAQRA
jgi:hypothetical protein